MKTTIDLDEDKLERIMRLTGIKTRKEAIDFALTEAERSARLNRFLEEPFFIQEEGPVVDPAYDLARLRDREKPSRD